MNIHIARQIARKLRRQRAFSKLTKRDVRAGDDPKSDNAAIENKDDEKN